MNEKTSDISSVRSFSLPDGLYVSIETESGLSFVSFLNEDGSVRWKKGPPIEADWASILRADDITERVQRGKYQYVNGSEGGRLYVVFTPYCELDFNVAFNLPDGAILGLSPSR